MDSMFDFELEEFLPPFLSEDVFNPWSESQEIDVDSEFIGHSDATALWREQTTPFTCAVVTQQMILERFGIEVSEAQLVYDSVSNGWLTDQGTNMEDVGALLDFYGIPVQHGSGGGVESLIYELARGHKVIVAVDSGELWNQNSFLDDWLNPSGADHAIMVNGIDASDPNNILVIVNDPGVPDGAGVPFPLEDFIEAWNDSGQFYMSTSIAPPELASMPVLGNNFNADTEWYFDQDFWQGIIGGIVAGVSTGVAVFDLTGDEAFADMAGLVTGGVLTFAHTLNYFDGNMVDDIFYSI